MPVTIRTSMLTLLDYLMMCDYGDRLQRGLGGQIGIGTCIGRKRESGTL